MGLRLICFAFQLRRHKSWNMPLKRFPVFTMVYPRHYATMRSADQHCLVSSIAVASFVQKEHCRECLSITLGFSKIGISSLDRHN